MQAYSIQHETLPEINFFTGIIQKFSQLFRNSYFKEPLQMAASTYFSCNFAANFEHVFASLIVVLICLSYCLQKESNCYYSKCDITCDMWKLIIF